QVASITLAQVPFLKTQQYGLLPTPAHLQQIPTDKIRDIPLNKLAFLCAEQFVFLSGQQIARLPAYLVDKLPNEKLYLLTTAEQMARLSLERRSYLTSAQLKVLYPKVSSRVYLLFTGLLYGIARVLACLTGLYLMALCCNCLKGPLETLS